MVPQNSAHGDSDIISGIIHKSQEVQFEVFLKEVLFIHHLAANHQDIELPLPECLTLEIIFPYHSGYSSLFQLIIIKFGEHWRQA